MILGSAAALGLRTIAAPLLSGCEEDNPARPKPDDTDAAGPAPMPPAAEFDAGLRAAEEQAQDAGVRSGVLDALVIGSGYGSAVTALRLTEKGIPVTMLEMGRAWDKPGADGKVFCNILSADDRAMWRKTRTSAVIETFLGLSTSFEVPMSTGALDVVGPPEMQVYCGRGVGGGSIVNLAMFILPDRGVFSRVLPQLNAEEMFTTYYPRALKQLGSNDIAETYFARAAAHRYTRVAWEACKAAGIESTLLSSGYDFDYMAREEDNLVPRSALDFECMFGNNYGKRSLDKTYLADAMGTGLLTIHALTMARRITRDRDGNFVVRCVEVTPDGSPGARKDYVAKRLFLGGGSMGTSELLVRSRENGDLADLNEHVGTAWGPNSDIFVARSNPLWLPTGDLQSTVPAAGFHTRDQDGKTVFSMHLPVPTGFENYTSFNIVMTESPEAGHFRYNAFDDSVSLIWEKGQNDPAVKSARFVFDKVNVANGTSYREDLFSGGVFGDRATYHPVGGCPLSRATDDFGRVRGYDGLYVVDGSLIPVGIGANPSLSITALAERNVTQILKEDFKV
jgi:cholesterol oxidase